MKLPVVLNQPPNVFKRRAVHRDLEKNQNLWEHVAYFNQTVGVFGLENCDVHGITYYLVVKPGMEEPLVELATRWKPGRLEWSRWEECHPFDKEKAKYPGRRAKVLKVVWVV